MDVTQQFAVRYYRWALLDTREESSAGFPLICRLGDENAKSYLAVMNSLDAARRQTLLTAFLKRFHPQAVELLDDGMSREEEALLDWADDQRNEMCGAPPAPGLRIFRRKLEKLVKAEILARFGGQTPLKKMGPKMFSFESSHGPWVVHTWFDCGRRPEHFHNIKAGAFTLVEFFTIQSWMGISSTTDWTIGPVKGGEIAKTMIDSVQRFLDAAPDLLDGLSPPVTAGEP